MPKISVGILLAALCLAVPIDARADPLPVWQNGTVAPNGDAGMLYMSSKGGFGPVFGLDIQIVPLRGDPLLLKALLADQIDSYIGGPASPLVAASRGADIRIVGCNWNKQSYALLAGHTIHTLADLKGKTIGISTPGSAPDIFVRAALMSAGISPKDVRFTVAGTPSDMLPAIAAGVIDATGAPDEYTERAEKMGLNLVTTSDEATPLSMQRCYFVTGATLRDHADRIARFLAAEMAAYTYSLSHRAETIALTRIVTHASPDAPEAVANYDSVVKRGVIDMSFDPPMQKLDWLRDILTSGGQAAPGFDPAKIIDLGPLAEARKMFAALGPKADENTKADLEKAGVVNP
jgi:NitT/TauT family transport system substrate-binding protein